MLVLAMIYARGYEGGSGAAEGARFGVLLNIGGRLAAELAVAAFFQWIAVGLAVALVYRPRRGANTRAAPAAP